MESLVKFIKTLLAIAVLVLIFFASYHFLVGKYNYEGADEPGYQYPDKVREEVMDRCTSSFRSFSKFDKITNDDLETICSCYLEALEENYSFKEFDSKIRRRVMKYESTPRATMIYQCAERNGFYIF